MTSKILAARCAEGLGLGAVALPALLRGPAQAQGGRVVVGTWGGDYARLLAKNIEDPLLKPKGFEVAQDQAGDAPRRTKMVAEKRLPRGTSDIQGLSAANMFEMNEAGVVETIDYSKLPNAKNLMPSMKYPYGVGHIYSGKVVVYNPKLIPHAPKSFKDAFDPKHGNKMGIIDIQYQYVMVAAALAAGGKVNDFEPGKALLLEAKKAGVRIYPTNEAFAQALKNEEIGIGIMWKARVVQWQNAGISVESVAPAEGVPMYVSGFVDPEERAEQGRRLRLHERDAGEERAGELRDRHGLQPDRHQRDGRARPAEAHRLHARRKRRAWSISTTATSPRTTPP